MSGRFWTAEELAVLKAAVGRRAPADVARALGRTRSAIFQAAMNHGWHFGTPRAAGGYGVELEAFIRAKHGLRWSATQIAEAWGCNRRVVARLRRKLGLRRITRFARLSTQTQFQAGQMRGNAARKYRAIGSVVLALEGRKRKRFIKIAEGRIMRLSRYLYEREHGPLRPRQMVVNLDGDCLNDDLANLAAMDRRQAFDHLRRIRPGVEQKRKTRCSAQARKRWALYRSIKAARSVGRKEAGDRSPETEADGASTAPLTAIPARREGALQGTYEG